MSELDRVLTALTALRAPQAAPEAQLQEAVADCLAEADISFTREAVLGPRERIDFLTAEGVGLELKKGRPVRSALLAQLGRYAAHGEVKALVVAVQKSVGLPKTVKGKPCVELSLNKLWGIAL